jgi:transcriptional regulator with AAA-type ATPase domain
MSRESRGAGETTVPAPNGGHPSLKGVPLGLRWLFPAASGPLTRLSLPHILLGRGEDCGSVLSGAEISRHHAEIVRDGPLSILRDLGSRNGSFVNGSLTREAPLALGDVVRLGEWVGMVMPMPADGTLEFKYGAIAPGLFGGPTMLAAVTPALSAARSDLPVILEGETGTGKELVARAIHAASARPGSFIAVNCAALPEGLAEAELFGYRRGAFTGAAQSSLGHFRAANGGTLLLDEVTDLPVPLQAKLLRALEAREVVPLGESQPVRVDVRVIAATQGSLQEAVDRKTFRTDLFARLDGLSIRLPSLRERAEDVPYLFVRLLHDLGGGAPPALDPKLIERLCLHDWPLNVRELVTLVRRLLVIHGQEPILTERHLPSRLRDGNRRGRAPNVPATENRSEGRREPPSQLERDELDFERLIQALRAHLGNVSRAAAVVGISRQRAYRLMQARPDLDLETLRAAERARQQGVA